MARAEITGRARGKSRSRRSYTKHADEVLTSEVASRLPGQGTVQRVSGRYAHTRSFIAATASHLFAVLEVETIPLRIVVALN